MHQYIRRIYKAICRVFFGFFVRLQAKEVGAGLRVNGLSKVNSNTIIGNNVNLNGMHIDGNGIVKIGNNFHSGKHCRIITDVHNYDFGDSIPYDGENDIRKNIEIEDNVWIGYGVIILGGVTLGEGSIVQAGSTVVESLPKFAIAGGHPAKIFKYRNKEHYLQLKQEKKFF